MERVRALPRDLFDTVLGLGAFVVGFWVLAAVLLGSVAVYGLRAEETSAYCRVISGCIGRMMQLAEKNYNRRLWMSIAGFVPLEYQ